MDNETGNKPIKLKAIDLYIAETGKKRPSNQIELSNWNQQYFKWLENKVEDVFYILIKHESTIKIKK
jgi:hypothetical protein